MLKHIKQSLSPGPTGEPSNKRREQIRRAQRTHRERRAKYLENLEAEIKYLRTENGRLTRELARKDIVNDRLRVLVAANGIAIPQEIEVVEDSALTTRVEVVGSAGQLQHLRVTTTAAGESSDLVTGQPTLNLMSPTSAIKASIDDAQTAISFVLALEQPCFAHFHQHVGEDQENGHAIQLQATFLDSMPPTVPGTSSIGPRSPPSGPPAAGTQWDLPTEHLKTQLETLSQTSRRLNLDGELVPVMCWKALVQWHRNKPISVNQLARLEQDLRSEIMCYGFGAVIDTKTFDNICTKNLL